VQLAVYRLAWHHLTGTPLESIRAAFHHVTADVTVRPADLLDEAGLIELVRSVPSAPAPPVP
jgi:DNA helicase II / ATP-dependent DNA helicase PcrA